MIKLAGALVALVVIGASSVAAKAEVIRITYSATITDAHYSDGRNSVATSLLGPATISSTFDTSTGSYQSTPTGFTLGLVDGFGPNGPFGPAPLIQLNASMFGPMGGWQTSSEYFDQRQRAFISLGQGFITEFLQTPVFDFHTFIEYGSISLNFAFGGTGSGEFDTCCSFPPGDPTNPTPISGHFTIQSVSGIPDSFVAAPVPEPSTWAMLLVGLAGAGFAAYRRRSFESPVSFR